MPVWDAVTGTWDQSTDTWDGISGGGSPSVVTTVLAGAVLNATRTHLNDDSRTLWTDPVLMPKLQEAYRELLLQFTLSGVAVLNAVQIINVPANTPDISVAAGYPTDMIEPIWIGERTAGGRPSDFRPVRETNALPYVEPYGALGWWTWQRDRILTGGSTAAVDLKIYYRIKLEPPARVTDTIGIIFGEAFLSYRTAAIALETLDQFPKADRLSKKAEMNLHKIIMITTKQVQNLPARRMAYHRGRGGRIVHF